MQHKAVTTPEETMHMRKKGIENSCVKKISLFL